MVAPFYLESSHHELPPKSMNSGHLENASMGHEIDGVVFDVGGKGLAGVSVLVFGKRDANRRKLLGIGATRADGSYGLKFAAEGEREMFCCYFLDGYEPVFLDVSKVGEGRQLCFDAIMPEARQLIFKIRNRLGFPLAGLQVQITPDGDSTYPITYFSNADGMAYTQSIFREGRHYWVSITSGEVELHGQWVLPPSAGGVVSNSAQGGTDDLGDGVPVVEVRIPKFHRMAASQ